MKTLLKIAVVLFIGYIVIDGLVSTSQHWGLTPTPTPSRGKMPSELIGKTFTCGNGFIAAFTAEDAERVRDLIKEQDRKAIQTMALQGRVIPVKKGTVATIDDIDVWKALEVFRIRGNPSTLYAEIGMIE